MRRCVRSNRGAWKRSSDETNTVLLDIGSPGGSTDRLSEVPQAYTALPQDNTQRNAGWQLGPNISNMQSTVVGASVCASLVSIVVIGLLIFWCRRRRRQFMEVSRRRNLWAATRWKRGPRNKASFVPLQEEVQQSRMSLLWNLLPCRTRCGNNENKLTPFPYEASPPMATAREMFEKGKRGSTCTNSVHLPQSMERSTSHDTSFPDRGRLKSRTTFYRDFPPPCLATPEIALPSPHLKLSERMDRGNVPRHSYILGHPLPPESNGIRYYDIMPSKISISETEDSPAGTSVCGLGLDLHGDYRSSTFVMETSAEGPTEDTMSDFTRWRAHSSATAFLDDPSMNDVSSIASFELAEVSGIIKPCFTLEKIEEFSGPVYVDQIASALTEAKILPSLSVQSLRTGSLYSAEDNEDDDDGDDGGGDLSSLFKETIALLQKDIVLHRTQASSIRPKTRPQAKTCPSNNEGLFYPATPITFDEMLRGRRSVEQQGREKETAPAPRHTRCKTMECHAQEVVEPRMPPLNSHKASNRDIGRHSHQNRQQDHSSQKTRQRNSDSSKVARTIRSSGTDPALTNERRNQGILIIDNRSSSSRKEQRIPTTRKVRKPSISSKKSSSSSGDHRSVRPAGSFKSSDRSSSSPPSPSSISATHTSATSSQEHREGSGLTRAKLTKGDWRSSDYHSPTLQVVRLYQDDDNSFDELEDCQEENEDSSVTLDHTL